MNINNKLLNTINEVIQATENKEIVWAEIENTYCLQTSYKGMSIVICRYPDTETTKIATFNFLGSDDYIIQPANSWEEGSEEYKLISNLYDNVCSMMHSYSCD